MKKHMQFTAIGLLAASVCACSDSEPVLTRHDWSDMEYFASQDADKQDIFYKPAVGFVGDPMPSTLSTMISKFSICRTTDPTRRTYTTRYGL